MFLRCPKSWLRDEANNEVRLFDDVLWFRKYQVMPNAGGKADQDPRWIEAVDIFAAEEAELRTKDGTAGTK